MKPNVFRYFFYVSTFITYASSFILEFFSSSGRSFSTYFSFKFITPDVTFEAKLLTNPAKIYIATGIVRSVITFLPKLTKLPNMLRIAPPD